MRRLKLEVDDLQVDSFELAGDSRERGTVRARGDSEYPQCPIPDDSINYCGPVPTAVPTCGWTCGFTCSCGCTGTQQAYTCTCPIDPDQG